MREALARLSQRCHNSDETHLEQWRTNSDDTGSLPQVRTCLRPNTRTRSNIHGRPAPTSQAEYAGSIPVIGSTKSRSEPLSPAAPCERGLNSAAGTGFEPV